MIQIPGVVGYDKIERVATVGVCDAYTISVSDGWQGKERFLNQAELIYVLKGELRITTGNKTVILNKGEFYVLRKYSTFTGNADNECKFRIICFECTLDTYNTLYGKAVKVAIRQSLAETLLGSISFNEVSNQGKQHTVDAAFIILLEILLENLDKDPEKLQMYSVLFYIDQNIATDLLVEDISEHFHYSADYISKIFKKQFGVSIKQYIIDKKLLLAKRLLTTSDISLRKVGQSIGFSDPILFEKFFKYHTKMTPKKYRELYL